MTTKTKRDFIFLDGFNISPHIQGNLRKLAADYASHYTKRQDNEAVMKRRGGQVEVDVRKPWTNIRIDDYVRQRIMEATDRTLDAVLGMGAGDRFRAEVIEFYGLDKKKR